MLNNCTCWFGIGS